MNAVHESCSFYSRHYGSCDTRYSHKAVTFITNYAEQHALVLPGRVPGFKRSDIRLLPSSETKASVWRLYKAAMDATGF